MSIEVACKGCQARYKVKDELAGRMVECKHCGQKFRVPYRSAVVRLGEDEEMTAPAETPAQRSSQSSKSSQVRAKAAPADPEGAQRSFVEYGLDPDDPSAPIMKRKKERPKVAEGLLPELVADLWLPLGLLVVTYGISLWVALMAMLRSNGPIAGCILLAIFLGMFFALVIPMTMRMIEGSSKTLDFEAPNAIWLQTAGLIGLPTMGMVVGGLGVGSIGAMIAFGIIGFVVMCPLMALMFRIDFLKGAQAAVLGALFYLMSLAVTGGVIAAVGLWLMPLWKLTRPWDEKPVEVATKTEAVAPAPDVKKDETPAPVASAVKTEETTKTETAVTKAEPVKPDSIWEVVPDGFTAVRWPGDVAHVLNVRPPVRLLDTAPHEPHVAVVDQDGTKVFDLRNGKRVGMINEKPRQLTAAISPDGAFIAMEVVTTTGVVPPSIEVWSVADGRMAVRIPANGNVRALGFDQSGRAFVLNNENGKQVVQAWDARTRRQVSTTVLEGGAGVLALSGNGRLLANLNNAKLRVYDLQENKLVGEKPVELAFRQIGTLAFSPDGTRLAASVLGEGAGPAQAPRIVIWDMADGTMAPPVQAMADTSASSDKLEMSWLPDGEGFLLGGALVDRTTGKTIHVPTPPTAGQTVGRPRAALSNFRVLYEIVPSGSSEKLVFRAAPLPKTEVTATIKSIRGEDWQPAPEAEPAPAVALANADPGAGATAAAASDAPTTKAVNPAAMKEWIVEVQAVVAADGPSLERQLRAEQKKLEPLESKHRELQDRATYLASSYTTSTDSFGRTTRTPRFSLREITDAKGAAKKALEEARDVKIVIARLNRELKGVTTQRTVTGTLVDLNIPVTMNVEGTALVAMVDPLQPGTKVKVTGGPLYEKGMLTIKLRSLTAAE